VVAPLRHSTGKEPLPLRQRPYKIAFCITELDPGGAERQLVRLATGLDRTTFEPEVICLSGHGALVAPLADAGIPVTCLEARGRWDVMVLLRLWRHLRRTRPDLLQTFLFHANLAGRVAARLAGVPVVVSGIRVAERRQHWHVWLDRWTDWLVDRHVCVSGSVATFSHQSAGLPAKKLVVIPNGVEVEPFASAAPADLSEFGIPANAPVVLFVGRLEEQKNPELMVTSFRLLKERHPRAHLLVVGSGPLREQLREQSGDLADCVTFAGFRHDVPRLLKSAACLAVPSRWEGMANVVLEAMAAGTPVVAAHAEGVVELLGENRYGMVVYEPNAETFAAALAQVLDQPAVAAEKAHEAQEIVRTRFTSRVSIETYERLYRELLGQATGGVQIGSP
jgi:glycosyltransferase involved in cell wall biosynthesis